MKDSCVEEADQDLCVDERYAPINDELDLCDVEPTHEEETHADEEETHTDHTDADGSCTSEYVFNKKIKPFLESRPADPTAKSIKNSLPTDFGTDVLDFTGGEPVDDDKLAAAEQSFKGYTEWLYEKLGLMRKCGDADPADGGEKVVVKVVKKVITGNVIYGNLEMKIAGKIDEAEDAATSALADALQVPEAAIIKAELVRMSSGRRLQDSDAKPYRLQYEVAVPPGQTAEQVLNKAKNLPQTIPIRFAQYGVSVSDVVQPMAPLTLTKDHGLFKATTTTLTPITEKMTWLQVVSRAVLLVIPCFAGWLGSIPGFEQKFCCK